jgi:hypothetical protein
MPGIVHVRSNQGSGKSAEVNLRNWGGRSMKFRLESIHGVDRSAPETVSSGTHHLLKRSTLFLAVTLLLAIPACSQETPDDLGNKSIEDLMNMENLLTDHHTEFNDLFQVYSDQFQSINSTQVKRSAYAKFTWHF